MASIANVSVTIELKSERGIRALSAVVNRLRVIRKDQPWNEDAKAALRALRTVKRELLVRSE